MDNAANDMLAAVAKHRAMPADADEEARRVAAEGILQGFRPIYTLQPFLMLPRLQFPK